MKRYGFVLVVLVLTIAETGCRRRARLFGMRGARCAPQATLSQVPMAVTNTVACPTVYDGGCPTSSNGGVIYGGETVIGDSYGGGIIDGAAIPAGASNAPSLGGGIPYGETSPSWSTGSGADLGPGAYGRPAFQVVGDRKLNPGESLPALVDVVSAPTQSDKTAQAPKKK